MPRKPRHVPLRVLLNNRLVGHLLKEPGGASAFRYAASWLEWAKAVPVSLSLPLREDAFKGEPVVAVFENLLPDSDLLRRRVAEKTGAAGIDSYSLLSRIGRDCVGALQFIPDGEDTPSEAQKIDGEVVGEGAIEAILKNLAQVPLGLGQDQEFRISVAGAQEKTALLFHKGKWLKPHGTTPTTHILKTQMGTLPNGIDLSNSVENEYYCLKLFGAFGLPVNTATIRIFGKTKALVVERFDRKWTKDGRLLRLPQEDCCQALSVPPSRKYQNEGGPGMNDILNLLKGSDTPAEDHKTFLKAQMLSWLAGATDAHAKNFSIFLEPGGRFHLTPLYDVMTAQPSMAAHQITRQQFKLAMSVGTNRHYRIDTIQGRHYVQAAERAGLSATIATQALEEIRRDADKAFKAVEQELPTKFPRVIHHSVRRCFMLRLATL